MPASFYQRLSAQLMAARTDGMFKEERIITTAQRADIEVADGGPLPHSQSKRNKTVGHYAACKCVKNTSFGER